MNKESKSLNHFIVPAINDLVRTSNIKGWILGSPHFKASQAVVGDAVENWFTHKREQYYTILERLAERAQARISPARVKKLNDAYTRRQALWDATHDSGGLITSLRVPVRTTPALHTVTPLFEVDHKTGKVRNFLKANIADIRKVSHLLNDQDASILYK